MIRKVSLTSQTLGLLGFVLASLLVGRGFTAFVPGHADARLFAYIGREWLSGVIPYVDCLLYTSPSPRDRQKSRMPSSA